MQKIKFTPKQRSEIYMKHAEGYLTKGENYISKNQYKGICFMLGDEIFVFKNFIELIDKLKKHENIFYLRPHIRKKFDDKVELIGYGTFPEADLFLSEIIQFPIEGESIYKDNICRNIATFENYEERITALLFMVEMAKDAKI